MIGMRIKDLENDERPRERIKSDGIRFLSDIELIAVVLRTGNKDAPVLTLARSILTKFGGVTGLANTKINELINFEGIGMAKACSLLAAFELSKRLLHPAINLPIKIRSPKDVFNLISKDLCYNLAEKLILVSLDSRGKFISKDIITSGTVNETIISAREIFQTALSRNASSIIIAHNHPSEDTSPSSEDIEATRAVVETGKLIGIPLLDHLIVARSTFLSLKQLGVISGNKKGGDKNEKI